jgi:hypothetical protein
MGEEYEESKEFKELSMEKRGVRQEECSDQRAAFDQRALLELVVLLELLVLLCLLPQ